MDEAKVQHKAQKPNHIKFRTFEKTCAKEDTSMTLNKPGHDVYIKSRHPVTYGCYSEIETPEAIFQFNLNHEIIGMRGKGTDWADEREWLKRSLGNDWVYYSTGGYSGTYESIGQDVLPTPIQFKIPSPYNEVYKATGEFYIPNFPYRSNDILGTDPFQHPGVQKLVSSWYEILRGTLDPGDFPEPYAGFVGRVLDTTPQVLQKRAETLFDILGTRPSVLPPDTRHVDYNVIPLSVTEGCLYKCDFCTLKTPRPFSMRPSREIEHQIKGLQELYEENLINYNAIFLGDHDALNARPDFLITCIEKAIAGFRLHESYMQGTSVYLFGSVDAFLGQGDLLFEELEQLPCRTYINLGLESADQATLDHLGKPISAKDVSACFKRMQRINETYSNIEVTANFILGENLPSEHYEAFLKLVRDGLDHPKTKGTVYFSPLLNHKPSRRLLFYFHQLKRLSRLPTFLYTIQRL